LDDALRRFPREDYLLLHGSWTKEYAVLRNSWTIVCSLFTNVREAPMWRTRLTTLIGLYDKHQVLPALGQSLVRSISALTSPMVSDAAARAWRDVWQELTGDRKEFQIPLRLLDAAVRYRETHDRRVLLALPVEERKLLEPLLESA
jgi:hypothetical protein